MFREIEFIARHKSFVLSAFTMLFNHEFTLTALVIMALGLTLMESTWKEFFASALADWNYICTLGALFFKE